MESPVASKNSRAGRCFRNIHDIAVTTTGVRLPSTVALPTDVLAMPWCQKARSRAKARPANTARRDGRPTPPWGSSRQYRQQWQRKSSRQKATADGTCVGEADQDWRDADHEGSREQRQERRPALGVQQAEGWSETTWPHVDSP